MRLLLDECVPRKGKFLFAERASYIYWYSAYQLKIPYETIDAMPPEAVARIEKLRQKLESDPRVKSVVSA
jgi:hypothetical protein